MIEALTGLRVRVFQAEDWPDASTEGTAEVPNAVPTAASPNGAAGGAPASVGWGLAYDRVEIRVESQSLAFLASGRVVLTDGRTIDFRLGLQLQSSSVDVRTLSLRAGDAALRLKDPLVLSLDGTAPTVPTACRRWRKPASARCIWAASTRRLRWAMRGACAAAVCT